MSQHKKKSRSFDFHKRRTYLIAGIAAVLSVCVMWVANLIMTGRSTMSTQPTLSQQSEAMPLASGFIKNGEVTFISAKNSFIAKFDVEIADDEIRRELGLMGRATMEPNQGMLFVFASAHPVSFWMKNTILSLDMVMIDEHKTVITIHKNTTPYSEQTYPSTGATLYVVELNAGITDRYGIKVGDKISWQRIQ